MYHWTWRADVWSALWQCTSLTSNAWRDNYVHIKKEISTNFNVFDIHMKWLMETIINAFLSCQQVCCWRPSATNLELTSTLQSHAEYYLCYIHDWSFHSNCMQWSLPGCSLCQYEVGLQSFGDSSTDMWSQCRSHVLSADRAQTAVETVESGCQSSQCAFQNTS